MNPNTIKDAPTIADAIRKFTKGVPGTKFTSRDVAVFLPRFNPKNIEQYIHENSKNVSERSKNEALKKIIDYYNTGEKEGRLIVYRLGKGKPVPDVTSKPLTLEKPGVYVKLPSDGGKSLLKDRASVTDEKTEGQYLSMIYNEIHLLNECLKELIIIQNKTLTLFQSLSEQKKGK